MIDIESRTFKCPKCHKSILSRKGSCVFCHQKFDEKTLFSCPRCGALVALGDEKCPGCSAPLSDSGIGPGTMTEKEVDALLLELETLSKDLADKLETSMEGMSPEERDQEVRQIQKMLELQISGARELGIRDAAAGQKVMEPEKPVKEPVKRRVKNGAVTKTKGELKAGMVNGTKPGFPKRREKLKNWMYKPITERVLTWQLLAFFVVIILFISTFVAIVYMNQADRVIDIDGDFSDWESVSSYSFAELLQEPDTDILEAKMDLSENYLHLYYRTGDAMFSSDSPSAIYAFIDVDGDPLTGYDIGSDIGADILCTLVGWSGIVTSSTVSIFGSNADSSDWNGWADRVSTPYQTAGNEIEQSIFIGGNTETESAVVRIVTVRDGTEGYYPNMSKTGTILARQTPFYDGELMTTTSQPTLTLSMILAGTDIDKTSIEVLLVNESGFENSIRKMQISRTTWTTIDVYTDMSSYQDGDVFSFDVSITSDEFSGAIFVLGAPASGYYRLVTGQMLVDGQFGDWTGKKTSDTDEEPLTDPNIDIMEYGATTEAGKHFFFVSVAGDALGGANVPEQRSKQIPEGPSEPIVRLKKTGEDLLQIYIDEDPDNDTGRVVQAGDFLIHADLLIEIFGRNGMMTSSQVRQWSQESVEWSTMGDIEEIAIREHGIELSASKTLMGDLSGSEIVFFTTDWKELSDHSRLGAALADPWVILEQGSDYRSADGINWALGGSISLEPGDRVVDLTVSPSREYVFAITNTGRAYRWWVGQSSSWSSEVAYAISGTIDVVAMSLCSNSEGFAFTATGELYNKSGLAPITAGDWSLVSQISGGYSDFADLIWRTGASLSNAELYAMRDTKDTYLNLTTNGGSSWSQVGSSTGSSQKQTQMAVMPGTTYDLYVLGEGGELRYSSDSGTNWGSIGDLPSPDIGNDSKYRGIAVDAISNIWVITDTGYCYKSEDDGTSFDYTGRPATLEIVNIVAPIPEFQELLLPALVSVIGGIILAFANRRKKVVE